MTNPAPATVEVRAVAPADALDVVALMERDGSTCFCRYWHFAGTNKEWEARVGLAPSRNRDELIDAIGQGREDGQGLIAIDRAAGEVVGWLKLTPRRALTKLTARPPYRALPDDEGTLSIACFLVDPRHRRHGVATALVEGAIDWARRIGARFLEAYPRVSESPLHDGEAWLGPIGLYRRLGFETVREAPQHPVVRMAL